MNPAKNRQFKMHPELLFSVIYAQAGTPEKALLEAIMNAVDAGAKKCVVTIDEKGYVISDDGKGFTDEAEVSEFFETFGTPHKENDAVYGRFRMGRGQLFAFSASTWRTNTFEMQVDVKNSGLDYSFKSGLAIHPGCEIRGTWYEPFSATTLFNTVRELEKLIKYMQIPVYINGTQASSDMKAQSWTYQDEDMYIKVQSSSSTLAVYNMGALVTHYSNSKFGIGGTIVSKKALKVNFARNDVLVSQCPIWKKVVKKLNELMGQETAKKTVLTQGEREAWVNQLLTHERFLHECGSKGLLLDISGKKLSVSTLLNTKRLTVSTGLFKHKKKEEQINDSKRAVVLAASVLDQFGVVSLTDFVEKVNKLIDVNNKDVEVHLNKKWTVEWHNKRLSSFNPIVLEVEPLLKNLMESSLPKEKLTKKDKVFLVAVSKAASILEKGLSSTYWSNSIKDYKEFLKEKNKYSRKIAIGQSDVAHAWTDGKTYITVNEKLAGKSPLTIVLTLLHEYCHTSDTCQSHDHGSEFYELYHDLTFKLDYYIKTAITEYMKSYNKACLKEKIKPTAAFDTQLVLDSNQDASKQEPESILN